MLTMASEMVDREKKKHMKKTSAGERTLNRPRERIPVRIAELINIISE